MDRKELEIPGVNELALEITQLQRLRSAVFDLTEECKDEWAAHDEWENCREALRMTGSCAGSGACREATLVMAQLLLVVWSGWSSLPREGRKVIMKTSVPRKPTSSLMHLKQNASLHAAELSSAAVRLRDLQFVLMQDSSLSEVSRYMDISLMELSHVEDALRRQAAMTAG